MISERLFEQFCDTNVLSWRRLPDGKSPMADYSVVLGAQTVHIEIKQIDADPNFHHPSGVQSRTVGSHIRQKIVGARKQIQAGSLE